MFFQTESQGLVFFEVTRVFVVGEGTTLAEVSVMFIGGGCGQCVIQIH